MPPDSPEHPREYSLQDVLKDTKEKFGTLSEDIEAKRNQVSEINDGLPTLDTGAGVTLKKQQTTHAKFEEVATAFERKDYGQAIKKLFEWIFKSKYSEEGLGYLIQQKNAIPMQQTLGIIRQLERTDSSTMSLKNKVLASMINGEMQRKLEKEYAVERTAQATTFLDVEADGMTLEQAVTQHAGDKAAAVLEQMKATANHGGKIEPLLLGIVRYNKPLPKGVRLFFDAQGFPLHASFKKVKPSAVPPIPVYRHKKAEEIKEQPKNQEIVEFLKRNLRPGDVIITSGGGEAQGVSGKLFQVGIRMIARQEEEGEFFHGTHSMYMGEGGVIQHMTPRGFETGTPDTLFLQNTRYKAITVLRMPEKMREQFKKQTDVQIAQLIALTQQKKLTYDRMKAGKIGANIALGNREEKVANSSDDSCICTDPITKGATGVAGLEDLARGNTPEDIAAASQMRAMWSFEFDRGPRK